ncbi:MAG: nickel-dependent lactate racemase [Chloracidobacterium sp.]|nr:nickel-dependent lactate racemase [Chloracidobacterium sp.]
MAGIDLKYGRGTLPLTFDESRFDVLAAPAAGASLSDAEINGRLDRPISSAPLEDLIAPGETILLVVPDATRQTAAAQIINLLVRRLIANGTAPHEMTIIFATGIHRKVSSDEKAEILTPFIYQRIKTIDHGPRDLMQLVRIGETSGGIPVELNRALVEHDHVVLIGGVTFHYFAGFTGGRKLVCPGLASARTIAETHKLAFDCSTLARREGVDTGLLDGNAVHEAFVEAAAMATPRFAINTIVNDAGEATEVFCGDWIDSHRAACDAYAGMHTVAIAEKRDLVIASCGGRPFDINMIQAHKALDAASRACTDGGTIVLLAECPDGLGRDDMIDWFSAANSRELAARLCEKYQVNGQTAWSLLQKAERFDIRIVTSLADEAAAAMRLRKVQTDDIAALAEGKGFIIPTASTLRIS